MNSNPNNENKSNNNDNNEQEKEIPPEQVWNIVDKLFVEEKSKRKNLDIKRIGTFVDPQKEQEEREKKEYQDFFNFNAFLNKASIEIKIKGIHKHNEETNSSGRNWQSAPKHHLLAKIMNFSESKSKKIKISE